jgi:hypothetical protein
MLRAGSTCTASPPFWWARGCRPRWTPSPLAPVCIKWGANVSGQGGGCGECVRGYTSTLSANGHVEWDGASGPLPQLCRLYRLTVKLEVDSVSATWRMRRVCSTVVIHWCTSTLGANSLVKLAGVEQGQGTRARTVWDVRRPALTTARHRVDSRAPPAARGLHSCPFPLNLSLLCPCPLNLSLLCPPNDPDQPVDTSQGAQVELKRERCVPRVLKLSCEVSQCKPLPAARRAGADFAGAVATAATAAVVWAASDIVRLLLQAGGVER